MKAFAKLTALISGLVVLGTASVFAQTPPSAPAPGTGTAVKGYTRKTKSGKMVTVKGYTRGKSAAAAPKMATVKGYTRKTKSGKMVTVKGYTRKAGSTKAPGAGTTGSKM